ncbi:gluconokinase [Sphingomonadaceae bacterium OTU29MARTA1]|nr:gluconokinase [Sphingomonadaceae bacterium OTU29MARTA1]
MTSAPLVVMGVSGSGKSTLAQALAARLGRRFVEGDACHPPANIVKMAAGVPLTDEDRRPFLDNVAASLCDPALGPAVASCSALKRSYRDRLRARCENLVFVLPYVLPDVLVARMQQRAHFMPLSLLADQLATLERPGNGERAIILDGTVTIARLVAEVESALATLDD